MEKLNQYLQALVADAGYELHLEPNKAPYSISAGGTNEIEAEPVLGTQISTMIFPLIPDVTKKELINKPEIEFVHQHNLGKFNFLVKKSPAGFNVTVRLLVPESTKTPSASVPQTSPNVNDFPEADFSAPVKEQNSAAEDVSGNPQNGKPFGFSSVEVENIEVLPYESHSAPQKFKAPTLDESYIQPKPAMQNHPVEEPKKPARSSAGLTMNELFQKMAELGASDLHLSVSMPPMIRKDGKMMSLEDNGETLTAATMKQLLTSIMPPKNLEEFERRHDTDFAYEIKDLARFRANIFMDRKGMGGVFRIIPTKILTAEQLGLSKAIMDLCSLSKGLVVVTGPTGSGKSTTLCAMVDSINKTREDHIITIEDPIEFTHENQKCLVNQREVHNHTDSFKDALRAALREDPDILLVGEMRDLETISIAIETAETGHLVFGTLHTTTAASTIDRIIDQFPADRQQQIRVMLSESLKGVIAQTLLPKKGGGRVAALEVLIVTPAISNLIREGKTFQIPSAMQTGKMMGMVMLNDALMELAQKGLVEPRDAYIKAVEKTGFEALLTRNGFKL